MELANIKPRTTGLFERVSVSKYAIHKRVVLYFTAVNGDTECPFCDSELWPVYFCVSCENTGIRRDILRQTF